MSRLFFFLPSTTDRKEKINRWVNNVNLHPINCLYDDFKNYATQGSDVEKSGIQPQDLGFHTVEQVRLSTRQCILNFMKHALELSNNNLMRYSNALMQSKDAKIDKKDFSWINNSLSQTESKIKPRY